MKTLIGLSGLVLLTLALIACASWGASPKPEQIKLVQSEQPVHTVQPAIVQEASPVQPSGEAVVRPDNRFSQMINTSLDEEVERAVSVLAAAVNQKTTIEIGKISYAYTDSVSSLSLWLKNSIIVAAQKQRDKFQVASQAESSDFAILSRGFTEDVPAGNSPVQVVITGNYSPLDNGAQVSIHLISTGGNRVVLASSQFVIPVSELERRKLSLLPESDSTMISLPESEARQQALVPYADINNEWEFSVTPNVLDGIYYDGDFLTVCLYSERDCYFRIIHVDVNGNTQVIYPVNPRDDDFIRAGNIRLIPDNTLFKLGPPFGEEVIVAAGYDRAVDANQPTGMAPFGAEIAGGSSTVESDTEITPLVTAKFSYTILPR